MEFLGILQPVWEIGKCLYFPLERQINYARKPQKNFEKLKQKVEELNIRRTDVKREIEKDDVFTKPSEECKAWLEKVDDVEKNVSEIEAQLNEEKKCLARCCCDILWRIKLGKRIKTMQGDIAILIEKSTFVAGVVVAVSPRIVEQTSVPTIVGEASTIRTIQNIFGCLEDVKIGMVGVWGMGGVGKTTVLENLKNKPEISKMYQIVIWVTVSKERDMRMVQKDIARRLSLVWDDNDQSNTLASRIFEKLMTTKYLLLLDDVWDTIDLRAIGVPSPSEMNDSKIILTTRFLDVCRRMEVDEEIKVDVLSEKEAWNLFCKKVDNVFDCSGIESLAKDVVKECGGLPLVLVVIGRSLRRVKDVHVWRNALTELKNATFQIDGDMVKVFKQLKFSYDRLKDDNARKCFLYCALYPEDFKIRLDDLIEHWRVEGFIDSDLNFCESYDKGRAIVTDLTNASLLERSEEYPDPFEAVKIVAVKMHDVIRDLALRITSGRFIVKAGVGVRALPNEKEWEQAEKISLMGNDIEFLPNRPECTILTTLLFQITSYGRALDEIPESFFECIHSLRVLNLTNTPINKLPSSLLNLSSLRGLYLTECDNLYILPSGVGQLSGLGVLHVGGSINFLPIEVGQLIRLKSLRVHLSRYSHNHNFVTSPPYIIPDKLLSRLILLEDLRIRVDDIGKLPIWFSNYETNAVGDDLVSLKHLISLHIQFPKPEHLEHFLQNSCQWKEPRFTFGFVVGHTDTSTFFCRIDQLLKLSTSDPIPSGKIGEVLSRSRYFSLYNKTCKKLSDLCSSGEMINGLEYCFVDLCDAFETLIDDGNGLPNLEVLDMSRLPELRSIWEGPVPPQSVKWLRKLRIWDCPKLTNVFSRGMILHLSNLENLSIQDCPEMVEVCKEDDNDDVPILRLPKLKFLTLNFLPKLIRICKRAPYPIASSMDMNIAILGCPNLTENPFKQPAEHQPEDR